MQTNDEGQPEAIAPTPSAPLRSKHSNRPNQTNSSQVDTRLLNTYQKQLREARQELAKTEALLNTKIEEATKTEILLAINRQQLKQYRNLSILQYGLNFVCLLLLGIGINLITSTPPNPIGWAMIGITALIQGASFYTTYTTGSREKNQ